MTVALTHDGDWSKEYEQLVIDTYCKGATPMEAKLFASACKRTRLEPGKQIYAVKRWDSALKREVMTVQTGIDGYRLIAERTGCYVPGRESSFVYGKDGNLISATAYVKKLTKDGVWHEIPATAFYEEYVQKTKDGTPTRFWKQMPHGQLAKCAEALALRKTFPAELSGVYTSEEMSQATAEVTVEEVEREISPEECATYLNSYGQDKEEFCEYLEEVSTKKNWNMNKIMNECVKRPEGVRKAFQTWKSNKRPIDLESEAQGE